MYINNIGIVKMFRGDSLTLNPFINNGTEMVEEQYEITAYDTIYFGLMEYNQEFENAILKKVYTIADIDEHGNISIKLNPSDTVDLLPGKYFYSIKLKHNNNENSFDVYTLLQETEFWILR